MPIPPKCTCNGHTRPVYVSDVRLSKKITSKETGSKSNLYVCITIHKCIIICKIITQCGKESAYGTCTHMNYSCKLAWKWINFQFYTVKPLFKITELNTEDCQSFCNNFYCTHFCNIVSFYNFSSAYYMPFTNIISAFQHVWWISHTIYSTLL